ncbi:MAG: nickel pincer cofactor biosynthesis protein LarB [Spirochaetaceae bacterium]|nr:nickel pincer cofactor biosynthesis protein LarB [Spirochaetaceae bacterium]
MKYWSRKLNHHLKKILSDLSCGNTGIEKAEAEISALYSGDLGFARIDIRREERTGFPEVVYCAGKSVEQAEKIISAMRETGVPVFATRASPELAAVVRARCKEAVWDELSKTLSVGEFRAPEKREGLVVVAAAGTSDIGVASEAARTAEFFGSNVELIADIGVAGIHRLFSQLDKIRRARVIIACAGMEGALAGVLAGLVAVPVIALPTSTGYGAASGGIAALLGMLSSCAPGISVVNIDNGFGAGYQANLINLRAVN